MNFRPISFFVLAIIICSVSLPTLFAAENFRFTKTDKNQLVLTEGTQPIFSYQFDCVENEQVPEKSARRFAGCYIHPLYGINGEMMTVNAPLDHFHHHGIFWTWPHVCVHHANNTTTEYNLWEGKTFPALKQHFIRWITKKITPDSAIFEVENGWFVGEPEKGNKIMSEQVKVTVHRIQTSGDGLRSRAIDFEFLWKPVTEPISLRGSEGKSYGGFSIRFNPFIPESERSNKNAEAKRSEVNIITVPNGIAEKDLPETPLAWADYTSRFDGQDIQSGAAIFVPKTYPDYPPTWLTRYYGAMCVGWPGVNDRLFQPNEEIRLQYQVWVHDQPVTLQQIENAYENYITADKITDNHSSSNHNSARRFSFERNKFQPSSVNKSDNRSRFFNSKPVK